MNNNNLEIERRWLLKSLPPRLYSMLPINIAQHYAPDGRLRRVTDKMSQNITYYLTNKTPIEGTFAVIEHEREITEKEYNDMLGDQMHRHILKRRYKVHTDDGLVWEIDEFNTCTLIIAEVEIPSEDHPVEIPAWLEPHIILEITGDKRFSNYNLAVK